MMPMKAQEVRRHDVTLPAADDFGAFREEARRLLSVEIAPSDVDWHVNASRQPSLFGGAPSLELVLDMQSEIRIDRKLLALMKSALLHSDSGRFALAYRVLWKSRRLPQLFHMSADADIVMLNALAKSVRRDIHKMHAFVRFRKVGARTTDKGLSRDIFIAWFEPDHHITRAVGPFFRDRFAGMDWTIITPEATISWDGDVLTDGPGGSKADVPAYDAVEEEWRGYYSSIFNPARVKPQAMKSEMPVKYWKNLPEAELIAPLMNDAKGRVRAMIAKNDETSEQYGLGGRTKVPEDWPENVASLADLNEFAVRNDKPPSHQFSNVIVVGEGPDNAPLMLIGEQPGDQEDIQKRPFVGPAGQLLTRAIEKAGMDRDALYLTNAVKRFKFQQRGKRRIHASPNQGEISHYRWWLMEEIRLVKPKLIIPMGASAILALLGKREKLSTIAGQIMELTDGPDMMAAYHPSYILRLPDEDGREIEYRKLVRYLAKAREAVFS